VRLDAVLAVDGTVAAAHEDSLWKVSMEANRPKIKRNSPKEHFLVTLDGLSKVALAVGAAPTSLSLHEWLDDFGTSIVGSGLSC